MVRPGVHPVDPPRPRFGEGERAVHQSDGIVQAVESLFDPFDLRAALDHSGDVERDAHDRRRLICLTACNLACCLDEQRAQHNRDRCFDVH